MSSHHHTTTLISIFIVVWVEWELGEPVEAEKPWWWDSAGFWLVPSSVELEMGGVVGRGGGGGGGEDVKYLSGSCVLSRRDFQDLQRRHGHRKQNDP